MSKRTPEERTKNLAARKAANDAKTPMTKTTEVITKKWRGHGKMLITYTKVTYTPTVVKPVVVAPEPEPMSQQALDVAIAAEEQPWTEVEKKS